jgi:hypothetical protein
MNSFGARRRLLAALAALPSLPAAGQSTAGQPGDTAGQPRYPTVRRGVPLVFPRDFGAHIRPRPRAPRATHAGAQLQPGRGRIEYQAQRCQHPQRGVGHTLLEIAHQQ